MIRRLQHCLLACIALCSELALAQQFPDAPQPQSDSLPKGCYISTLDGATTCRASIAKSRFSFIGIEPQIRILGWGETANSKTFWTTHAIGALGVAADEYVTFRGESHGCLEKGQFGGGYHATFGRIGTVDWSQFGAITIIDFLLRKAGIPIAPYSDPLVLAAKHSLGTYHWTQTGCL